MPDGGDAVAIVSAEKVARIAPENLRRALEEDLLGRRDDAAERQSRVVNAVFATDQVLRDQRAIRPRQHVVVQGIDGAEGGAHLAGSHLEATRESRKRDIALFQVDALLAEAEEKICAGVGVENGLEGHLAFVHFEKGGGLAGAVAGGT